MKIIGMRAKKQTGKTDMFAVLCLIQSGLVILTVVLLFVFSKINSEEFLAIRKDIAVIFDEDIDIGGYFTPSEGNGGTLQPGTVSDVRSEEEENVSVDLSQKVTAVSTDIEYGDTVNVEKTDTGSIENTDLTIDVFSVYSSDLPVMPVIGKITSDYGQREHPVYSGESFHEGRDIAADEGSPVYAALDGCVIKASVADKAGKYVKLKHADGTETLYCHCSELLVSEGVNVRKGDVIALVGQTGLATGPHLHFEYHIDGKAVDPELILEDAVNVY